MRVFVLLFLVSVLNIGVGFALAVYLGFAPPRLRAATTATEGEGPSSTSSGGGNPAGKGSH